ncbi:class I SAM-dependent methyltransferase [Gimesia chilikensis]|uniref:class I SAM-dependent methyltransferase n=1 Tax=Gimesia chilikensis TaxID=2605989 RepID=UPI003A8DF58A
MPLVEIELSNETAILPDAIIDFLSEADARIRHYVENCPSAAAGFVPSHFKRVYHALQTITDLNLARGTSFCEWGSGFGVVTSLASMLEFMACGIEIEQDLVEESRRLADDFGLPVEFVQGSFIPAGAAALAEEAYTDNSSVFSWLITDAEEGYKELQRGLNEFDIIFAYPWPGEDYLFTSLFEKYAAEGALLLTYDYPQTIRLLRKLSDPSEGQ